MTTADMRSRSELLDTSFRLRPDIELITGADDARLLFDPVSRRYTRLGGGAVKIVQLLDGTRTGRQLANDLAAASPAQRSMVEDRLAGLLQELGAAGVFVGVTPAPPSGADRLLNAAGRTPTKTFQVLSERRLAALIGPVGRALAGPAGQVAALALGLSALAGLWLAVFVWRSTPPPLSGRIWLLALLLLLLQMVIHELGHATVSASYGVTPRSLGFALWYYLIPIAYVDRTDAYRLRSRAQRVAICLVGPALDMVSAGLAAFIALHAQGTVHGLAVAFVTLELASLVVNFNPMLPTDGQQAFESATGQLNLRHRAMRYVASLVARRPLPAHLQGLSRTRRWIYLLYGSVCLAYLAVVFLAIALIVPKVVLLVQVLL